jgi:hypothetical protein
MKNYFKEFTNWFVKLFSKDKTLTDNRTFSEIITHSKEIGKGRAFGNNRKRTRGRIIQVINLGNISRVIYHSPSHY